MSRTLVILAPLIVVICLLAQFPPTLAQSTTADERLRQATALFGAGKYSEAAAAARQARERNPQLLPAWKLAGLALQLSEQPAAAAAEFTQALQLFPAEAELWFYLARVQYQRSLLREAEQAARQAVQRKPDYAEAHAQLGLILEAASDYSPALTSYRRAIDLNRQRGQEKALPLYQAGLLLGKLGQWSEALELLTRAEKLEPRVSELHVARGRLLEQLGRGTEAAAAYKQAIALDGNPQARTHLARLNAAANSDATPARKPAATTVAPLRFRNVAASAKLNFTLRNSASGEKYLVEAMTGGVAVIDYDNDGWEDIYFVNGAELPAMQKTAPQFWNRLFRNNHDGTFRDVTEQTGTKGEGYAMGASVADYDNDGDQDLFVTGVHRFTLFRNEGNGRFRDVTAPTRLSQSPQRWSVAAAWLDFDNDGWLDLFVVNYVNWQPGRDPVCGQKELRTYCLPDRYDAQPNQLFRNNGDGTFTDVSATTGIAAHSGKGMGVAIADYDDDGFVDVFVANDTLPNFLFHNNAGKGFTEVALHAGTAFNDSARPVSSMGVDFRDYDNDGWPDLIVSALEGETFPLFRNAGKGFFSDVTWPSGLGTATIRRSGWSLGLFDFNNDGHKDLFTVNAHVNDQIEQLTSQTWRQAKAVLANLGNGAFTDVSRSAGAPLQTKAAHRGAAFADFNHDGKIDVVTTALNEPAELLLNEADAQPWLTVQLIGQRSNRDGLGARLKLVTASGRIQFNHATTSVGYASSSTARVHFGLGAESKIKQLEIRWPSGIVQRLTDVATNRVLTVHETN